MPVTILIKHPALTELRKRMGPNTARVMLASALRDYAPHLQKKLVELSPGKRKGRTGQLRKRWVVDPITGASPRLHVRNRADYSGFVEWGTRAHAILPRQGHKALRWRTEGRGQISSRQAVTFTKAGRPGALHTTNFVFRREVMHPGTKRQLIFGRAFKLTGRTLLRFIHEDMEKALATP